MLSESISVYEHGVVKWKGYTTTLRNLSADNAGDEQKIAIEVE